MNVVAVRRVDCVRGDVRGSKERVQCVRGEGCGSKESEMDQKKRLCSGQPHGPSNTDHYTDLRDFSYRSITKHASTSYMLICLFTSGNFLKC